jgi:hypothetical protein
MHDTVVSRRQNRKLRMFFRHAQARRQRFDECDSRLFVSMV